MTTPGSGAVRHARSLLVSAVIVALSVAGHLAGGGRSPHPLAIALLLACASVPAYAFARRRLGIVTLIALLGAGQYAVHYTLAASPMRAPGHSESMPTHGLDSSRGGLVMLVAHLVATFVAAGLLAHGDSLLWTIWRLLSSAVRRIWSRALLPLLRPRSVVAIDFGTNLISRMAGNDAVPRAPPVSACPFAG